SGVVSLQSPCAAFAAFAHGTGLEGSRIAESRSWALAYWPLSNGLLANSRARASSARAPPGAARITTEASPAAAREMHLNGGRRAHIAGGRVGWSTGDPAPLGA